MPGKSRSGTSRSVRYIPKRKTMKALRNARNKGNRIRYKQLYNNLSVNEKRYVNQQLGRGLQANAAPFRPALNPLAAPFETEVERTAIMAELAAEESMLPQWTTSR